MAGLFTLRFEGVIMTYRIGTANYSSLAALKKADPWSWEERLKEGVVLIGEPTIKIGEKLLIDSDGRYHIEVQENNKED